MRNVIYFVFCIYNYVRKKIIIIYFFVYLFYIWFYLVLSGFEAVIKYNDVYHDTIHHLIISMINNDMKSKLVDYNPLQPTTVLRL